MSPAQRAHAAVAKAVREGRLAPPGACVLCGTTHRTCHHHASYEERDRLNVVPLCRSCHSLVHAGRLADPGVDAIVDRASAIPWPLPRVNHRLGAKVCQEWPRRRDDGLLPAPLPARPRTRDGVRLPDDAPFDPTASLARTP